MNEQEKLLSKIAFRFVGIAFEDLSTLERQVAKLLIGDKWLFIDENGEVEVNPALRKAS